MELNGKKHDLSQRSLITTTATADGADAFVPGALGAGIGKVPSSWDFEADVVVIGAGAAGLPAAIKAADEGASVIVVEANYDVGGHAIISGGNVPLGGGTSAQKKIRHRRFSRRGVSRFDRLDHRAKQRLAGFSLQRPRSDARVRRSFRADL